jgi:uncharacterized RDD family membrane protein YckC
MDPYNSADTHGVPANPYAAPRANVAELQPTKTQEKAGRGNRLAAVLIDAVPIAVVAIIAAIVIPMAGVGGDGKINAVGGILMALMALLILGYAVYQLLLLHRNGQTFGKKMMNIKIVRNDGSRASLGRIFGLRMFVPGLIGAIPFVGGVFSLIDPLFIFGEEKRCLHDLIADTIVINA